MALKVGIVGIRGIGVPHVQAYKADPLAELVAVCDMVKERADDAAAKYGVRPYYSLAEMLRCEPDLDIVDVCTGGAENGGWHYEPAMQAMEAGKNVLVEKPLSDNIAHAREMVKLAAQKRVYLGCNLNHFFTPPAERARQYMDEGAVGELIFCLAKMGFQGVEPAEYHAPESPEARGFPYFHLKAFLSHPLSVMRHFCGDVTQVQAFLEAPTFRRAAGDVMLTTASVHLKFANHGVGYLLSQRGDASYGLGGWWSIEVGGTRGTFCIENCIEKVSFWKAPAPQVYSQGGPNGPEVTESGIADFGQTFPRRIHAFLEDITNQAPLSAVRASGRDALAVLEYTFAIIESYENGGAAVEPHPLPAVV